MNTGGYEIERKFLIEFPDIEALRANASSSRIEQTYLLNPERGVTERVRMRESAGKACYTHTVKSHVSAARCLEDETEISRAEYLALLKRADPGRRPVKKERFCLTFKGRVFEIDTYPFWADRAVMEIELGDEHEYFEFPPEIRVIRELTGDARYTNASIAEKIPHETLPPDGTIADVTASYEGKKD